MVDNIELNSGSGGATVKTDDDGTAHWQYVKLAYGADNTQNIVGSISSNPLPVALSATDNAVLDAIQAAVEGTVTVSGTVTANLSATDNAVLDQIQTNTANLTNALVQDDAPFTPATGYLMMIGGEFDDAAPDSVDEGDAGNVRISANRSMHMQIRDAAGNERGLNVDASGDIGITNSDLTTLAGAVSGSEVQVDIVSGTVTANLGATDNAVLDSIDSAVNGTLTVDLGANNDVTIDNSSVVATEDGASGGSVTGIPPLAVRDDSLSALTPVEGDYVPLRVNSTGALHVTGGGGGTQYAVDDAAGGTDTGTLSLAIRDDSLTTLTPADGDYVGLRVSSTGALHVTGGGGGTEYTEDVATPAAITGTATVMERDDALATLTPIEGDWAAMRCSAEGALWVQEANSDDILADTANMDTNLGTIAGAVAGSEMQVDIVSGNVTNAGTFAVQADNIDGTEDAAAAANPTGTVLIGVRDDEVGGTAVTSADGDYTALRTDQFGALEVTQVADATSEVKYAAIDAASSGDNTIVAAAGAGVKVRVLSVFCVATGDVLARFEDGAAGTALTGQMDLTTNSGFTLPYNPGGWFETSDNTLLNLELDGAVSVDGCITYVEV